MVTNEQRRRQLAREKFERQQQRREAQRRKARNRNALIAAGLAVLIAAGGTAAATGALGGDDKKDDKASADATPSELPTPTAPSRGPDPCAKPAAGSPAKKTWKSEPEMTVDTSASYTMALKTTCGNIDLKLDAAKAPHTVNSLNFLAGQGYFDHTKCHRLTGEAAGIYVLQCGDPQGTGAGGPGYTLAEENLKSDLLQEPKDEQLKQAKMKIYPAGTIAMAKTQQPHSTGSQFFLVYKDSPLQPDYTPVGTIGAEGRKTLDKIAGAGIQGGAPDGPPNATVVVDKATVAKS